MMMMMMQKKNTHHTDQPNHRRSYAAHMNDNHFPLFCFSAFLYPFLVCQTVGHNLRTPTFVQIPATKIHFVVTTVSLPVMGVGSDIYQKWLLQLGWCQRSIRENTPKHKKTGVGRSYISFWVLSPAAERAAWNWRLYCRCSSLSFSSSSWNVGRHAGSLGWMPFHQLES